MNKYIFASSNRNKIVELSNKLPDIELLGLADLGYCHEIIESGKTLESNAFIKAQAIYDHYNIPCISDDTGLEVYALDNRPGVYSARYAGIHATSEENIQKLLNEMRDFSDRRARFRTVLCFKSDSKLDFFEGIIEGSISFKKFGINGFGYDPIFIPHGFNKTFAQMTLQEKNSISHRGQAIMKLATYLNIESL